MDLRQGFRLGGWSVQPLRGELVGAQGSRHLQPKTMDVLLKLVETAPAVAEREQLVYAVWGERAVSDEPLTRCIAELRKQLGDQKGNPHYIETIPKRGYRLLITGEPIGDATTREPHPEMSSDAAEESAVPDRSLAVMPFSDLSGSGDQGFFAEGIADEIITTLAAVSDLKVAARTSSFKLIGEDHATVRRLLGVRFVLEGSVRRFQDRVRVNFRLVDTGDGFQRLARKLKVFGDDILGIQDAVAHEVIDCLPQALIERPAPVGARRPARSIQVNDLYLRGLHKLHARDLESAAVCLQEVCRLDPEFAPAQAAYAQVLALRPIYLVDEPVKLRTEALRVAKRALQLDPESAQAHAALGAVHWAYYSWSDAESELFRAVEINPREATARHWYGMQHLFRGRLSRAQEQLEIARQLDPLSPAITLELGTVAYMRGNAARAEQLYGEARDLDADHKRLPTGIFLGMLLMEQGRREEALAEMAKDGFLGGLPTEMLSKVVDAVAEHRRSGSTGKLPQALEAAVRSPTVAARFLVMMGDFEGALTRLRRGFQICEAWLTVFAVDPIFKELRARSEGKDLLRSLGLGAAGESEVLSQAGGS